MADGKLYIIVTDQLPNGGGPLLPDQPKEKDKEKTNALGEFAQHQFFNLIERQTKQAVSYTLNNIGNFTGDYVAQQQVNNVMGVVQFAERVGLAAIAGAKYGGWGSLIAAGIVVAGEAANQGMQFITGYFENKRQNRLSDQLRTRSGLNSVNNGSRGTEY